MQPTTPEFEVGPWRPVADGVYVSVHEPDTVTLGLVVGADGAVLVDVGSGPEHGAALRRSVATVTDRPLVAVVVTHAHTDHAYGLPAFDDLPAYGHESLAGRLPDGLAPSRPIAVAAALDLGGRRVEVVHLGRGHTDGDLIVVVPDADLLFAGDLVESAGPPAYGPDSVPEEWAATLDGVLGLMTATTRAVPGHGDPVDREFVFEQRGRIAGVALEVERLAGRGVPEAEALAAGSWPFPAEALADAVAVGYARLGASGRRPDLPLA